MNQTILYYDKNAEEFCETTKNADMSFCRDKFLYLLEQRYYIEGKDTDKLKIHILDAGCGSGRDAKVFLDMGYQVTALDASKKICEEAGKVTGQEVFCMQFEDMEFRQEFDGIWACASLLHVSYTEINKVMKRIWDALRENGVFYASFKYGKGMRNDKGRLFYDYDEITLKNLAINSCFWVEDIFVTQDVRNGRENEQWINVLARKIIPCRRKAQSVSPVRKQKKWLDAHRKICNSKKMENGVSVYLPIALFLSGITVAKNGNIIIGLSGVYVPFYLSGILKRSKEVLERNIYAWESDYQMRTDYIVVTIRSV